MKKLIIIGIVILLGCSGLSLLANRYTKPCTVWYRDGWDVIVEDNNGNLWQFEDRENYLMYSQGDNVLVTFDTNGTDTVIEDDSIVRTALID